MLALFGQRRSGVSVPYCVTDYGEITSASDEQTRLIDQVGPAVAGWATG